MRAAATALTLLLTLTVGAEERRFDAPRITTCHSSGITDAQKAWRPAVAPLIEPLMRSVAVDPSLRDGGLQFYGKCPQRPVEGCVTIEGLVYCSEEAILRIAVAAAWAAAAEAHAAPMFGRDVLELADAEIFQDTAERDRVRRRLATRGIAAHKLVKLDETVSRLRDSKGNPAESALYRLIGADLLAILLGHEFSHHYGTCPITGTGADARAKLIDAFVKATTTGELFCNTRVEGIQIVEGKRTAIVGRMDLDPAEVDADECALHALAAVDARVSGASALTRQLRSAARQRVLDLALWFLSFPIDQPATTFIVYKDVEQDHIEVDFGNIPGYLLRPFRVLLIAATLSATSDLPVRFCGESAELMKLAIDWSLFDCRRPITPERMSQAHQRLPEEVTRFFPPAVREGWQKGTWSGAGVYRCEPAGQQMKRKE